MRNLARFCCAVALCVVVPTAISAQTDPKPTNTDRNTMDMNRNTTTDPNGNTTVTAKVVSTSGTTLVVETETGNRMTFDTSGTTMPYGASVGTWVQIAYAPNQLGSVNRLSTVTVVPASGTATADTRYGSTGTPGSMGTTGSTDPMNTDRTGTTNTDNPDLYASNSNLPRTGSLMPLLGMLGVFALVAGVAVRIVRFVS